MFGQNVCIWEKFTTCKNGDSCSYQHPTLVCDDKKCDILICHKRHPQICLFDTIFKACRNGDSCRFLHKKTDVLNESDNIGYKILEEKYNAILEDFKLVLTRIEALERSKNEEQMLHEANDVVDSSSRKRLSRVISDFNVDKEASQDEEITAVVSVNDMPLKKKKSNPLIINNEYMNIKYLHDEASKIKEFVRKEKMISKGVHECKEKLKHLKFEMKKRGNDSSNENILVGMFNGLCDKVDKIQYKNFKKETIVEFDKFLDICKKEKLKSWNQVIKVNNMKD